MGKETAIFEVTMAGTPKWKEIGRLVKTENEEWNPQYLFSKEMVQTRVRIVKAKNKKC